MGNYAIAQKLRTCQSKIVHFRQSRLDRNKKFAVQPVAITGLNKQFGRKMSDAQFKLIDAHMT